MTSTLITRALTQHYQHPAQPTDHLFEPGSLSFPALAQSPRPTSLASAAETRKEFINQRNSPTTLTKRSIAWRRRSPMRQLRTSYHQPRPNWLKCPPTTFRL